tara:strand:- start:109 stop:1164 length:1056 start_codon:yes stop_codon:yes gene_type:complete
MRKYAKPDLSVSAADLLTRQASAITSCLDDHIPGDRPVALLLFPLDDNVGNHMMWLAITEYLESRGIRIAYLASDWDFNIIDMIDAIGDGTILFIGGVSVSRLWPEHAAIKRAVAAACPDNRLISLPSTMLFVDEDDRREASTIFGEHRDVVLMARDPVSAASARDVFPSHVSVVTIHDSAFLLPPQPRVTDVIEHDVIWLARGDMESAGFKVPVDVMKFDWPSLERKVVNVMTGRVGSKLGRSVPNVLPFTNRVVGASYRAISQHVLSNGNRLLDQGSVLVTDRLHPHVLAVLRGQPCVLLPDRFGKNRSVWEYSSNSYNTLHWADDPEQALEIAYALAYPQVTERRRAS